MLIKTYDQTGKELAQTRLPAEIFGVAMNKDLVHQIVLSQAANRRQVSAHAKGRGEVSGGGKNLGVKKERVEQDMVLRGLLYGDMEGWRSDQLRKETSNRKSIRKCKERPCSWFCRRKPKVIY